MFNKEWFKKWQSILLWFCNTPLISILFRWILRINGNRSSVDQRKIIQILPNSITWIENRNKRQLSTEFRGHDKFAKRLYYTFKPIWYVLHAWDTLFANNFQPNWNLGFDTTGNLFPAAGANSPMDGTTERNAVNETYANIRAGAGTASTATQATLNCYLQASATTDQFVENIRGIVCFDASAIPDTATIDAATFSGYFHAKTNQLGSPDFHLAGATPASTSSIASADYGQCQTTSFGNITYANFTTGQYNDITLNASGLAAISKTAVTSFSLQQSWDINASFGGTWSANLNTTLDIKSADEAGTANDPKLVVIYTLAVGGGDDYAYLM